MQTVWIPPERKCEVDHTDQGTLSAVRCLERESGNDLYMVCLSERCEPTAGVNGRDGTGPNVRPEVGDRTTVATIHVVDGYN